MNRWAPGAAPLADAARAIARIAINGRSAEEALAPADNLPHRAAVRAIALGSVRWYLRLAPAIDLLLERPERLAPEVRALLIAGAHQIEYSRNPAHASVHAAVDAARILRQERATGLVNAVLRRLATERDALLARVDTDLAARTAHPQWLVQRLVDIWPEQVASILDANNAHPPLVLRVDTTRVTVPDYVAELAGAGIAASIVPWLRTAVQLEQPVPVTALPGFETGRVSVQDAGAQLAAPLLDSRDGMRVLDACAAPGGKTGHLLEHTPGLAEVVAVDVDAARLARISDNLDRLGRTASLAVADARDPGSFWDGRPFDRILLDAPCSSTGVIRRHPDIKLLRRATDIPVLAETQLALLVACFSMLAPGGRLVYSTCSVLPEENEAIVARFLATEPRARLGGTNVMGAVPGGVSRSPGIQLVPGAATHTDGFYYACLENTTTGT